MRFSTLQLESWTDISPYIDTLCIPIYSLRLSKQQIDVEKGKMIEFLVDSLEKRLTGRMLILPAISFTGDTEDFLVPYVTDVLNSWSKGGFEYIVLVMDQPYEIEGTEQKTEVYKYILQTTDPEQVEFLDKEVEVLYEDVLNCWVKKV